jgi:hypothetical protein
MINPYLDQIQSVLPRLLALYDDDPCSPTYGQGDRRRWAWRILDFGNATFQGAVHGLARLLNHQMLPSWISAPAILRRIDAMIYGTTTLRYPNGSVEESFPYESSFCVTALVAFDLLSAQKLLHGKAPEDLRKRMLETTRPLIEFLLRAKERHAFISNHLATASAALFKWHSATGETTARDRATQLLHRLLAEQSEEGWFREYQGADPGYQTLCTYYLADIHRSQYYPDLLEPLRRSVQFVWHFCHPDGSFGGLYGSRNTRFYYPAGYEALAGEIPEAEALAQFMRKSIQEQRVVTLLTMDEPNLIPFFNAYSWAATFVEQHQRTPPFSAIPCKEKTIFRRRFREAGLLVDKGNKHYTVISWHKGGVYYHFPHEGTPRIDAGVVLRKTNGTLLSTQAYNPANHMEIHGDTLTVIAPFTILRKHLPTPLQFIVLRGLNLTVMRNPIVLDWVKKLLVWFLITNQRACAITNQRTIDLGPSLTVRDVWSDPEATLTRVETDRPFSAGQMASQGYWQRQDDELQTPLLSP